MYDCIKFGNIAVKYQPDMYMIEATYNPVINPIYNEYVKGKQLKLKVDSSIVSFERYDPIERRIYLKYEDGIRSCSESEFHEWVGRKDTDFVIGVPDPVMIDSKTGMPYTNIGTTTAFLYELCGYKRDLFKFAYVDYSKKDEVDIIMETVSDPHDYKILKFIKNDNGTYTIDNPPRLLLRSYYKRL